MNADISKTALFVAYLRSLADIPYAKRLAELSNAKAMYDSVIAKLKVAKESDVLRITPLIESRGKAIDNLVKDSGNKNILEIAAGLSPRGLMMTEDVRVTYLETDLSWIIHQKKQFVYGIPGIIPERKNLIWAELDALNPHHFYMVRDFLPKGPVTVVSEGFNPYMNDPKRMRLAANILQFLEIAGENSIWIMSDIVSKENLRIRMSIDPALTEILAAIADMSKEDFYENAFERVADSEPFFENLGLDVEMVCQKDMIADVQELTSINLVAPEERYKLTMAIGQAKILVMRPK
jgi:O-methyltransferase involved in polyketide biosynthesis